MAGEYFDAELQKQARLEGIVRDEKLIKRYN
jgi:hypothetical protein